MKKLNINFDLLLGKPSNEYEKFHALTKTTKRSSRLKLSFKKIKGELTVKLPPPEKIGDAAFKGLLSRRSSHDFSSSSIKINTLSGLLDNSLENVEVNYPFRIYILSLNSDVGKGFFFYSQSTHSLLRVGDLEESKLKKIVSDWVKGSGVIVVITTLLTVDFSPRDYRFMIVDSGKIAQNFYIISAALNLTVCAFTSLEEKLEKILGLNKFEESIVYTLAIGNKP